MKLANVPLKYGILLLMMFHVCRGDSNFSRNARLGSRVNYNRLEIRKYQDSLERSRMIRYNALDFRKHHSPLNLYDQRDYANDSTWTDSEFKIISRSLPEIAFQNISPMRIFPNLNQNERISYGYNGEQRNINVKNNRLSLGRSTNRLRQEIGLRRFDVIRKNEEMNRMLNVNSRRNRILTNRRSFNKVFIDSGSYSTGQNDLHRTARADNERFTPLIQTDYLETVSQTGSRVPKFRNCNAYETVVRGIEIRSTGNVQSRRGRFSLTSRRELKIPEDSIRATRNNGHRQIGRIATMTIFPSTSRRELKIPDDSIRATRNDGLRQIGRAITKRTSFADFQDVKNNIKSERFRVRIDASRDKRVSVDRMRVLENKIRDSSRSFAPSNIRGTRINKFESEFDSRNLNSRFQTTSSSRSRRYSQEFIKTRRTNLRTEANVNRMSYLRTSSRGDLRNERSTLDSARSLRTRTNALIRDYDALEKRSSRRVDSAEQRTTRTRVERRESRQNDKVVISDANPIFMSNTDIGTTRYLDTRAGHAQGRLNARIENRRKMANRNSREVPDKSNVRFDDFRNLVRNIWSMTNSQRRLQIRVDTLQKFRSIDRRTTPFTREESKAVQQRRETANKQKEVSLLRNNVEVKGRFVEEQARLNKIRRLPNSSERRNGNGPKTTQKRYDRQMNSQSDFLKRIRMAREDQIRMRHESRVSSRRVRVFDSSKNLAAALNFTSTKTNQNRVTAILGVREVFTEKDLWKNAAQVILKTPSEMPVSAKTSDKSRWSSYNYWISKRSEIISFVLNVMLGLAVIVSTSCETNKGFLHERTNKLLNRLFAV